MSVSGSLRRALRDFYDNSWRLLVLNVALTTFVLTVLGVGVWFAPALALLTLAGPLAAGLMHCAVTVVRDAELSLGDAVTGVRLHWRRGLALGLVVFAIVAAAVMAVPFYAALGGVGWTLAVVTLYVTFMFGMLQLLVWPLAVLEPQRALRDIVRAAVDGFLRRPIALATLAFTLLALNVAGVVAALVPFLTLTVAYSFLAAAHFALPRPDSGGTTSWPA